MFDLLGDIFTMPIDGSGGPAKRIAGGPAFDMQPRFSPDGQRIAFTSDRDGLWNIWTMNADGEDPRQISRERRWFINSPTWSPDGDYIYARRHFVQERSLGAGEIWMYHSSGPSDGLQVTERNGWQKDAGEPAISPDGKVLYYSRDVTPGQTFEYNKDPNGTIYAVMRRDLVTGRERRAISVQGGSVAPRSSPDGKTLAYIRRVRLQSHLFLRELESGRDRQLFSNVDKDLQEAWAIHGLYPQYAWTPDGKSIVIWGEGKIWRVDVASGKGQQIPFTARVEQTINDAVRFPQQVHQDEFPVRMLRDVRVSPDGKLVVYSALGHLYVRSLPDGQPKRLTTSGAQCERMMRMAPAPGPRRRARASAPGARRRVPTSSSRPSRVMASGSSTRRGTTRRMGRVRVIRPDGMVPVTSYAGPATTWSRRSRRTAAGSSTVMPAATSGAARLQRRARRSTSCRRQAASRCSCAKGAASRSSITPARGFTSAKSQREEHAAERRRATGSSHVPGRDEIEHVRSDNATQYAPSPDGNWIAFEERFEPSSRRSRAPAARWRSGPSHAGLSRAARLARCRLLPALVWRQQRLLLGARSGALHARSSRTFAFVDGGQPPKPERPGSERRQHRLHREERQAHRRVGPRRRARDHDGRPQARCDRRARPA